MQGRSYPVTVLSRSGTRVELEVAGERVVVENWPEGLADPPGAVDVNGERSAVTLVRDALSVSRPPSSVDVPAPSPAAPVGGSTVSGAPVLPPMPGKVVEVRVREGDRVRRGEIVLVVEAMKMRNEVPSPADGVVEHLVVEPGSNVRAKEPMLYVRTE